MARGKSTNKTVFEHVISILMTNPVSETGGRVVPVAELQECLGDKLQMSRMSVYMWEIKKQGIVVKSIRDGRKVVSYQIVDLRPAYTYMQSRGHTVMIASNQGMDTLSEEIEETVTSE